MVVEQLTVHVEGLSSGRVTEHALYRLHVLGLQDARTRHSRRPHARDVKMLGGAAVIAAVMLTLAGPSFAGGRAIKHRQDPGACVDGRVDDFRRSVLADAFIAPEEVVVIRADLNGQVSTGELCHDLSMRVGIAGAAACVVRLDGHSTDVRYRVPERS